MKTLLCLTLTLLSAATFCATPLQAAAPLSGQERAQLMSRLEALHASHPSMEASFSEQRTSHLLQKAVSSSGNIAFQSPNKFRREVHGSNPSITISNGRHLWIYYPNFKEVEEYALGQRAMFDDAMAALTAGLNFSRVESFYNLEAEHDGGGYRLVLTPKRGSIKRTVQELTVTLDNELNVRRTELILPKGDRIITSYSAQRRNPLPASTFEFTPPADAHVSRPLGK